MKLTYATSPLPGLEVLSCRSGRHFDRHLHDGYVLWLNSESGEDYGLNGNSYTLLPGSLSIIEPGVIHSNSPCDPGQRHLRSFYFSCDFLSDLTGTLTETHNENFQPATQTIEHPALWRLFADLHELLLSPEEICGLEGEVHLAFAELYRTIGDKTCLVDIDDSSAERVRTVIDFFHANPGKTASLADLAALVNCSSYHLIRLFRRQKGVSPHAYHIQLRLEHARRMLGCGEAIADAALEAGFSDQSHLTRVFKSRYGLTPGQYVRQQHFSGMKR